MTGVPRVLFVTGTDTGVGKTIATAALAAALGRTGRSVAVYKPVQAGTEDGAGDIDTVVRLAAPAVAREGVRLPDPMAPVAAAARAGVPLPAAPDHLATIAALGAAHDHVIVEGAGGLLVELGTDGHTLADLAVAAPQPSATVVVCRSGLGTLNHTVLTVEALRHRDAVIAGLLLGAWPEHPSPIEEDNRRRLATGPPPLLGAVPDGAGLLDPGHFRRRAAEWLDSWPAPAPHPAHPHPHRDAPQRDMSISGRH
ncbi:Dethiobiotin synthetase [Pseudonocardia sp. Ae168_Ps1]|uniref:dethiobiotin synthase n=1 Tax=unclassified Pseudonocardia TaxID=2619320 RepID=UPI00094B1510|nr:MULTISPECIES: dethiobiotin synthase [unclassified Pseudonocardia]OLL76893.1 Dethiobiotin synthetase [Pseudonocardia sp. Ae150A_Ps1]OLL82907.1 Dethiobiotin synthetase [Pseudonocardia sp. Ae168_Ps1]OLL82982.1 Dethiobiotin synthetase [Pseudonocardia sp. Ae263_Ps1]OLL90980.1 Dethiobiotin synthetase [Pseudonocardia sp. Ae356_Ps1]